MAKKARKNKDCGCDKSTVTLNEQFNYRLKPRHFTEDECKEWKTFKNDLELQDIGKQENIDYIHTLYNSVMNTNVAKPEVNSSIKPIIHMMDKLDIVYNAK
jgi:hypothetical protein